MVKIEIKNSDCLAEMKLLSNDSIDVILTDPPYLYLKGQKLEREFDERQFFFQCKRVLKDSGFIVLFGRGTSFYRWNTILSDLGFVFKEEIVWDKLMNTSPVLPISRMHETVSIHSKCTAKINKVKREFVEANKYDPQKIAEAIYRLTTTFGNRKTFELVKKYFETGEYAFDEGKEREFDTTIRKDILKPNRTLNFAITMEEGVVERSIMKEVRNHYCAIHPTQKPVRLLARLLALVIPQDKPREEITVLDPFGGSFSSMEAVYNLNINGISYEIDEEYFNAGQKRINEIQSQKKLF